MPHISDVSDIIEMKDQKQIPQWGKDLDEVAIQEMSEPSNEWIIAGLTIFLVLLATLGCCGWRKVKARRLAVNNNYDNFAE